MSKTTRTETDSMGPIELPAERYYGAQTARSLIHFPIGHDRGSSHGAARITRAYRLALGRPPTGGERRVAAAFLKGREPTEAWAALFQALFASADFRYVD